MHVKRRGRTRGGGIASLKLTINTRCQLEGTSVRSIHDAPEPADAVLLLLARKTELVRCAYQEGAELNPGLTNQIGQGLGRKWSPSLCDSHLRRAAEAANRATAPTSPINARRRGRCAHEMHGARDLINVSVGAPFPAQPGFHGTCFADPCPLWKALNGRAKLSWPLGFSCPLGFLGFLGSLGFHTQILSCQALDLHTPKDRAALPKSPFASIPISKMPASQAPTQQPPMEAVGTNAVVDQQPVRCHPRFFVLQAAFPSIQCFSTQRYPFLNFCRPCTCHPIKVLTEHNASVNRLPSPSPT